MTVNVKGKFVTESTDDLENREIGIEATGDLIWRDKNGTAHSTSSIISDVNSVNGQTGVVVLDTDDIEDTATNRYTNDTDATRLANTSGTNTGDQDISGIGNAVKIQDIDVADTMPSDELGNNYQLTNKWYQNLLLWSEDYTQSEWTKISCSVNDSVGVESPLSGVDWQGIVANNGTQESYIRQAIMPPTGKGSFGFYIKKSTLEFAYIQYFSSGHPAVSFFLNLNTGAVTSGGNYDNVNVSDTGNGYKVEFDGDMYVDLGYIFVFACDSASGISGTGDGVNDSILVQGFQLKSGALSETNSFPYYKTTTTAETGKQEYTLELKNSLSEGAFVDGDKTKLDSIETDAEVNNISDANATDLTDGGETSLHSHVTVGATGYYETADDHAIWITDGLTTDISLLLDGNMEKTGTTDWTSFSATLSKNTTNPYEGTQCLSLLNTGTNGLARPALTILEDGKDYTIKGFMRGDGAGTYPRVWNASNILIGTDSTTWQEINYSITADGTDLRLYSTGGTGGQVCFDRMIIVAD